MSDISGPSLILALENERTTTSAHFRTFSRNIPDRKHELAISRTSESQEVLFPLICLTIIITACSVRYLMQ